MGLTPINKIPVKFIRKTLTEHQKEYISIKYYIKQSLETWEGTRLSLYDELAEELPLSVHTIRKLGQTV